MLYWITGDPIYQQWGWEAFMAIEEHCRVSNGYLYLYISLSFLYLLYFDSFAFFSPRLECMDVFFEQNLDIQALGMLLKMNMWFTMICNKAFSWQRH